MNPDKDSFITVDQKVKRRLEWKLLFQEIKTKHDTSCEKSFTMKQIVNVRLQEHKPKQIDKTRRNIRWSTGSKIKKSPGLKVKLRKNDQCYSRSFVPEILAKDDKFDISVVSLNDFECVIYDLIENADDFKIKSTKNSTHSENNLNVEWSRFDKEDYSQITNRYKSSIMIQEEAKDCRTINDDANKKPRKQKKNLFEIVRSLRENSSSSSNVSSVLSENSQNLNGNISDVCFNRSENVIDKVKTKEITDKIENLPSLLNMNDDVNNVENLAPSRTVKNLESKQISKSHFLQSCNKMEKIKKTDTPRKSTTQAEHEKVFVTDATEKSSCKNSISSERSSPETKKKLSKNSSSAKNIINSPGTLSRVCKNGEETKVFKTPLNVNKNKKKELQLVSSIQNNHKNITNNKTKVLIELFLQTAAFNNTSSKFNWNDRQCNQIYLSTSDKKYIYSYSKHAKITNQYNKLLKILDFIEQRCPKMTKYILGMLVLESIGKSDDSKYNSLFNTVKKEITEISEVIQESCFHVYKEYVFWLYERRRKK